MKQTKRIRLYGIVQGVGFRPFVSLSAMKTQIAGTVCNRGSYVEVIARGSRDSLERFIRILRTAPPERSVILKTDVRDISDRPELKTFEIIESEKEKGDIFISPDIATCPQCRRELFDRNNRRYLHPFINCTQCGPRLTILDELPYDRARTSMKEFPMCPQCAEEYENPKSRRYDAQPVCCNECGPEVYIAGSDKTGPDAIHFARKLLAGGGILAVKGIGGFHLCCDATSTDAVSRLRERKRRPVKPFAVMMRDEETVLGSCFMSEDQRQILTGYQKPILLLNKKASTVFCDEVAPGNPKVGVMLPYAPIQMLLFDYPDDVKMPGCLVMTSGNVSGAPICRDDDEAWEQLGSFADAILSHDRKIRIRCDDSVMDFDEGSPYMIRRSRGYAPLPVLTGGEYDRTVLAAGGELKNTFCIGIGPMFYPSAYVGDLADPRSVRALEESVVRMETLLERRAEAVVCDLHPGYHSTGFAKELAKERGVPLIQVQHHFAHIVSCMAENDLDGEVLGASYDGTGWGTDGSIWGGELMLASRSGFERIGSIKPFLMVGGDLASREGWRIAASMLHALSPDPEEAADIAGALSLCRTDQLRTISLMADRRMNTAVSTSAGRLFDAVSAVLGICRESTFEGEASMALQFSAGRYASLMGREDEVRCGRFLERLMSDAQPCTESGHRNDSFMTLPTDALVMMIIRERLDGGDPGELAYLFHRALSVMTSRAILSASERSGAGRAVLSGGVYQNTMLLSMTGNDLQRGGMDIYTHHLIPPNDGGISLGQALAAQAMMSAGLQT